MIPGFSWLKVAIAGATVLALVAAFQGFKRQQQGIGAERERAVWVARQVEEGQARAKEGLRRLEAQERNQREQNALVARLRDAAARNASDADRVRSEYADRARAWADRLADSPTADDRQAAATAIAVCTDVRGRLDQAAGELAAYAGAAAAAGSKCEVDYDALSRRPAP